MEILVTNTLSRRKEPLVPRQPGEITMYVCGVTPYDSSHLGHARPAVVFDCIRRFLRYRGFRVRLVQNFTDVDDKIIARAHERGMEPLQLAQQYVEEYLSSMDRLGVERADVYPRVSEHICDVIAMVRGLVERGVAYAVDGDVFFDVSRFADYGKLSHQRLSELEQGTRFDIDERKRNPMDFALWKAARPGEPAWESPWGLGRPGWHIECSAMSLRYLGNHIDIHGGGIDLVFPHHENEIAQSEAFTGRPPFVRFWLHNGLVNLAGEKMSKSLGNFLSVEDALAKYPAALLRFFILSHHYRTPVDFAPERMEAARKGWQRLNLTISELSGAGLAAGWPGLKAIWSAQDDQAAQRHGVGGAVAEAATRFHEAMCDDFNTPRAIGVLFDLARQVRASQAVEGEGSELSQALGFLQEAAGDFLGILDTAGGMPVVAAGDLTAKLLDLLVDLRAEARCQRDWRQADHIRDRLRELGIALEDTPAGTRWAVEEQGRE